MVQKDKKRSIAGSRQPAVAVFAVAAILALPSVLIAESAASKNAKGNRLFAEGKFEEAEKAYLEAQVKNPGKPEILYNLGNALIKQKKYEQGIQSLRQSLDRGDKDTKENSWYNTGNALYSMGRFKESAEAYIQALKLKPTDGDAKHNLELALKKLKQQQAQADSNQRKPNPDKSGREQASSGDAGETPQQNKEASSGNRDKQNRESRSQMQQEARREGSISKEQALQILDALLNQEREQQRKMLEGRAERKANEKDW